MRAFLSCPIPKDVIDYITTLIPLLPKATFIVPKEHDLTMKFLGTIPEDAVSDLRQRLSSIHFQPFEAQLTGLGVFSERMIRIVWLGLQPADSFYDLHRKVDEALLPLFPPDERFLPHITLARVKAVNDRKAFLEALHHIPVVPMSFLVDRLVLIKSVLTSTGAIHTPIFEAFGSSTL